MLPRCCWFCSPGGTIIVFTTAASRRLSDSGRGLDIDMPPEWPRRAARPRRRPRLLHHRCDTGHPSVASRRLTGSVRGLDIDPPTERPRGTVRPRRRHRPLRHHCRGRAAAPGAARPVLCLAPGRSSARLRGRSGRAPAAGLSSTRPPLAAELANSGSCAWLAKLASRHNGLADVHASSASKPNGRWMHASSSPGLAPLHQLRVRAALLLRLLLSPQPAPAHAHTSRSRLHLVLDAPRPRTPVPSSAPVPLPRPAIPRTVSSLRPAAPSEPAAAVPRRCSSPAAASARRGRLLRCPALPPPAARRLRLLLCTSTRTGRLPHSLAAWLSRRVRLLAHLLQHAVSGRPLRLRASSSAAALASARGQAGCTPQAAPGCLLRPPLPGADTAWGLLARAWLPPAA
ncbi:hypothetical protein VPH35_070470 [Triticum aestivum]